MSDEDQSTYVLNLKENDVLCGRGSGPNDRTGNIEFRNLILTRKAEYLAAKTREMKGRIASDIVNNVRQRGGRFLKKLSPSEAKEAGYKRGVAVYELADEPTVLEKAKQTLRQNRAAFEKKNQEYTENDQEDLIGANGMRDYAVQTKFNHCAANFAAKTNNTCNVDMPAVNNRCGGSSANMSYNPIPLNQASDMLDSDKLPRMDSTEAGLLQNAIFASSSISSNNTNQMQISIDLSAILGSLVSNNSGGSGMSAEKFGSLIKDLSGPDQDSLIHQYKALQDQQQQALMHQYEIMKMQHQQMMEQMYPQYSTGNPNEIDMNYRQKLNVNLNGEQQHTNFQQQPQSTFDNNAASPNGINHNNKLDLTLATATRGSSPNYVERLTMNNFSEDSLSQHINTSNSDAFSSDVFTSLMREYQADPSLIDHYENSQHPNTNMPKQASQNSNEISQTSKTSNTMSTISEFSQLSQDPVIADNLKTLSRPEESSDQQKLLPQSSANHISASITSPCHTQHNDPRPNDGDCISKLLTASQTSPSLQPWKRLSVKPQHDATDESLTLGSANEEYTEFKPKEEQSSFRSSDTPSEMTNIPHDESLTSLMSVSISLSEISHDLMSRNPTESLISRASLTKEDTIQECAPTGLTAHDMSLSSLGERLTSDENQINDTSK